MLERALFHSEREVKDFAWLLLLVSMLIEEKNFSPQWWITATAVACYGTGLWIS